MSMPSRAVVTAVIAVAANWATPAVGETARTPRLGTPVAADIAKAWSSSVFPDGRGLPSGRGTARQGKVVYDSKCVTCHGPEGRGETAEELVGREVPLSDPDTSQTVGSYWPYATTLFDYTRRAMPMGKPGSLSTDEVYAVAAYLLHLNDVIGGDDEMNATTLPRVRMPNRDGFLGIDAK